MSHRKDLKPHCAKSYVVVYACSKEQHHRVALQKAEANGHDIHLICGN